MTAEPTERGAHGLPVYRCVGRHCGGKGRTLFEAAERPKSLVIICPRCRMVNRFDDESPERHRAPEAPKQHEGLRDPGRQT